MNGPPSSQSFVPLSVERVDKDKDADENVDAGQTRTGILVSGQPTDLFTQLDEIDIDFRVSGLPHAVVKQAENFRIRELVKKMASGVGVPKASAEQAAADSRGSRTCVHMQEVVSHGDGSMYSQAHVRAGKVLRPRIRALPSVIVVTEKVMREVDRPVER